MSQLADLLADLLADADLVIQPSAGHYPWLVDPDGFVATVTAFPSWATSQSGAIAASTSTI